MKKYAVSKETFNYITAILADKPSHLLHDWEQWLNANNVGSESYNVIRELVHFNENPSIVIAELLQGKSELELDEKKYRLYHKQNSGSEQFAYHYFTKSGVLQDSDDFDDVSVLAESNVEALAYYEGQWVWEWAHEVE